MERLNMSSKEIGKLEVIRKVNDKRMKHKKQGCPASGCG